MKIAFLTRSLNKGGAERQLVALAKGLSNQKHQVHIICFYSNGEFESDLHGTDIVLHQLNKSGRWDTLSFLLRLHTTLRKIQPDILHGYLAVPNIFAVFMRFLMVKTKVAWGVRASDMDLSKYDWTARLVYRIECFLSKFADLIIANSYAGEEYAISNGFPKEKLRVVSNGMDTDDFKPDPVVRKQVRDSWNLTDETLVIGTVARLDPMKDYELLLQAAAIFVKKNKKVIFVCVGHGKDDYTSELKQLSDKLELTDKVKWFGVGLDTRQVYNGFDLFVSTSRTEGFSNVIGEAMCYGLPCVVTDVGDSAYIVGEFGEVLKSRQPKALAKAWENCLNRSAELLSHAIRQQMINRFSIDVLVSNTESQLQALLSRE